MQRRDARRSKDKVVNREGRILLNKLAEKGWKILNGSNGSGGWTYIAKTGESVIDYAVANTEAEEEIQMVKEGEREESDHFPIEVKIKEPNLNIEAKQKREDEVRTLIKNV